MELHCCSYGLDCLAYRTDICLSTIIMGIPGAGGRHQAAMMKTQWYYPDATCYIVSVSYLICCCDILVFLLRTRALGRASGARGEKGGGVNLCLGSRPVVNAFVPVSAIEYFNMYEVPL